MQVQYNPDVTGPRDLISAVDDAGFEAQLVVARCAVSGRNSCFQQPVAAVQHSQCRTMSGRQATPKACLPWYPSADQNPSVMYTGPLATPKQLPSSLDGDVCC